MVPVADWTCESNAAISARSPVLCLGLGRTRHRRPLKESHTPSRIGISVRELEEWRAFWGQVLS